MAASNASVAGNVLVTSQEAGARQPLHVMLVNTSGNVIESFGGTGGTASTDGDVFATATTSGTPAMGVYEATPSSVSDGELGVVGITANRELKVSVTSGGTAGTQYTEGDTDSTITGTAALMEVASNTLAPLQGSVTDGLLVNLGANNDVTVTGTVSVAGVATAANQSTIIGHLDGVEGLLTTIDSSADELAGAVATIGTTTGLRVFVFDNNNTQVTSFGGSGGGAVTEYTEDAAAASNPVGGALILRRRDTLSTSEVSADGDNIAANATAKGEIYVKHVDTIGVTDNGGSLTVDGTVAISGTVAVSDGGGSLTVDGTVAATQSGTWNVATVSAVTAISNALPAGTNTIGGVNVIASASSGGHTPYKNLDVDETEDAIKASAGKLFWIHAMNFANAPRYLKLYNATVANVTVGTTTPVLTFPIPTMGDTNGAGFTIHFGDAGVAFDTAITIAATTGLADNNTGAPGANEVVVNVGYL